MTDDITRALDAVRQDLDRCRLNGANWRNGAVDNPMTASQFLAEVKARALATLCPRCDLKQEDGRCNCDEQIRTNAPQVFTDHGPHDVLRLVAMVEASYRMLQDAIEARMCGNRCKCILCQAYDELDRLATGGGM